jgi:hypothetical protein
LTVLLLDEHPGVEARPAVFVFSLVVRLIVVDGLGKTLLLAYFMTFFIFAFLIVL